jgi:hypothetical protein
MVKTPETFLSNSIAERFFKYAGKKAYDECWPWRGYVAPNGYGELSKGRSGRGHHSAHRVSWMLFNGLIPTHLVVDHLCRNRICVNPTHLRLCSDRENILCGMSLAAQNSRKSNCKNGHPLHDAYIIHHKDGTTQRRCRICEKLKHNRGLRKRLTLDQVKRILELHRSGKYYQWQIGQRVGTDQTIVGDVVNSVQAYIRRMRVMLQM